MAGRQAGNYKKLPTKELWEALVCIYHATYQSVICDLPEDGYTDEDKALNDLDKLKRNVFDQKFKECAELLNMMTFKKWNVGAVH